MKAKQPQRPHVILVTAHDLGRWLNCYGISTLTTPNLDRMATQGALLEQAFCTAPQCSPSRASIVTGRYPHSHGVMGLAHGDFRWDLHADERHMAQLLRDAGYQTYLSSWQHESPRPAQELGFDQVLGIGGKFGDRCDQTFEKLVTWMGARPAQAPPFMLQVFLPEVHRLHPTNTYGYLPDRARGVTVPPWLVDDGRTRDEFSLFQGAVRGLDAGMGVLLEGLQRLGIDEQTLVIFMADHGIPFPRAKCSLYDPGLSIAAIWRWPGAGFRDLRLPQLLSNVDFLPTLLDLLQLPTPASVQGRSFAPLLIGKPETYKPHSAIFAEMTHHDYCDPLRCIRTATHKLIVAFTNAPSIMDPSQQWRPDTWPKAPVDPAMEYHPPVRLYDLLRDPLEFENRVADPAAAEVRRALLQQLHDWMVETDDPLLQGIPVPPIYHRAMAALRTGELH